MCVCLAFSLFYISCSTEAINNNNIRCSDFNFENIETYQVANQFEQMLDLARTIDYQEDYSTFAEFHKVLYGESDNATNYVNVFEQESSKYMKAGFENYISNTLSISEDLKEYFLSYSSELLYFLSDTQPTLDEFKAFISNETSKLSNSQLCQNDQNLMNSYLATSQGYAQYYYNHFYDASTSSIQLRGCNFFEALGCGLLAIVVGWTVGIIVGVIILAATVIVDGREVSGDGKEDIANFAGFALGIWVGINIYDWCCGNDDVPEQECKKPTGATYIETNCNEFVYRIFGPSTYGATEWNNENTSPAFITTDVPKLSFSIPVLGQESNIICPKVACLSDGASIEIFSWEEKNIIFETPYTEFPLVWVEAPPADVTYLPNNNIPYFIDVNTPSTDRFTYTWSITAPHTINGGLHNASAKIKFNSITNATTTVSVLDNCTGISETIIGQTQIQ